MNEENIRVNTLKEIEISKKSNHFQDLIIVLLSLLKLKHQNHNLSKKALSKMKYIRDRL
jgi:hypothetical protein